MSTETCLTLVNTSLTIFEAKSDILSSSLSLSLLSSPGEGVGGNMDEPWRNDMSDTRAKVSNFDFPQPPCSSASRSHVGAAKGAWALHAVLTSSARPAMAKGHGDDSKYKGA